jgi:hypothetical protein
MSAGEIVILIVVILVVTFIPIGLALWFVRRSQRRRLSALVARFPNAELMQQALFYGQESAGVTQLRGNGVLALLPDQIRFEMLTPMREYSIPLDRITAVESPTSFLGKTNFKPLLKVAYTDAAGRPDSMAWLVQDVAVWRQKLGYDMTSGG